LTSTACAAGAATNSATPIAAAQRLRDRSPTCIIVVIPLRGARHTRLWHLSLGDLSDNANYSQLQNRDEC
jgi:hypothetical protein